MDSDESFPPHASSSRQQSVNPFYPRRSSKKGKLSLLPSLSLDILVEVFSHLKPLDLLHLSRADKTFRRTLLNRQNAFMWKRARTNIPDLPPCPPMMSEPAFINLAFDHHCQICGKNGIRTVDWLLRVRYCPPCSKVNFVRDIKTRDYGHLLHRLGVYPSSLSKYRHCYAKPQLEAAMTVLQSGVADMGNRGGYKEAYLDREHHAALCRRWAESCARDRSEELREVQVTRAEEIIIRLKSMGWEEEIKHIPPEHLREHPLIKPCVRLTERIWLNIRDRLDSWMLDMQTLRLRCERRTLAATVLKDFKEQNPQYYTQFMPGPADVCTLPGFSDIIEAPNSVDVTLATFDAAKLRLPRLIADWKSSLELQLADLAWNGSFSQSRTARDDSAIKLANLRLAMTVFHCRSCRDKYNPDYEEAMDVLHFPWAMSHRCMVISPNYDPFRPYPDASVDLLARYTSMRRRAWVCELECDHDLGRNIVAPIVEACGQDPLSATSRAMDQLDARVICLYCRAQSIAGPQPQKVVNVYTWRTAITHSYTHTVKETIGWARVSEPSATCVKMQESKGQSRVQGGYLVENEEDDRHPMFKELAQAYYCKRCSDTPREGLGMQLSYLEFHLITMHHLDRVMENDYYLHPSVPPLPPKTTPKLQLCLNPLHNHG